MGRFAAILLAVSGTVALQVVAQAVVLTSVRFIGRRAGARPSSGGHSGSLSAPWCRCSLATWHR